MVCGVFCGLCADSGFLGKKCRMRNQNKRPWLRWLLVLLGGLFTVVVFAVVGGYLYLRGSLPQLTGTVTDASLTEPVEIHRDVDGVPTLIAESESDLNFALGFIHAQERFFQMDLLRRAGAGELSGLLGRSTVKVDKQRRRHRFRSRAKASAEALPLHERALLNAYTAGVNAGLNALTTAPFEYALLGSDPEPWRDEDTFCVAYAMFFTLQGKQWQDELRHLAVEQTLPAELAALVLGNTSKWDAAVDESVPILRPLPPASGAGRPVPPAEPEPRSPPIPGSNNWAVAAKHAKHGGAIVADDMHLKLRMPNIWFRAQVQFKHPKAYKATGVFLPGAPLMIAGSNGKIAWGFTNSSIDTADLVVLAPGPESNTYQTPSGPQTFNIIEERIEVRGEPAQTLVVKETIWGPVIGRDFDNRQLALRWTAHSSGSNNLGLRDLTHAETLDAAIAAAQSAGIPNQNVMIASSDGRIGWTISGLIPVRPKDCSGQKPTHWHTKGCAWDGFAEGEQIPSLVDPPNGRLWTANNRIVGPEHQGAVRYQNPALGARASQIRDRLMAQETFSEADFLAIQLDDRALFLGPWQALMLTRLTDDRHAELRAVVENWEGRAVPESVGYRVVREFRQAVLARIVDPILAPARKLVQTLDGPEVKHLIPRHIEHLVWQLLEAKPDYLLPSGIDTWDMLLDAAVADVVDIIEANGPLEHFTWGELNRPNIQHPLSSAVPLLGRLIDPPSVLVPGDMYMPRVQQVGTHGASERFAVSPGKEEHGIFHMPAGQTGHPLSPYLHAGHEAWAKGEPTPFLPKETKWTLTLRPAAR